MKTSPEELKRSYLEGTYTMMELSSKLVECSKEYPVARILAVLDQAELRAFGEWVLDCASAEHDDEIVWINASPTWGLAEVRKFLPYVSQNPMPARGNE